ncbi:MAG: helix-turn-helix domain-containing protein [Cyanobacteriota bacterium]
MVSTDEQFTQAANHWDLETLYADLASAKGKRLTPVEKLHLRGLLCGYSPSEIAERLGKNPKGVETDLCATLYRYVKSLVDKCDEKIENWRNITEWLDDAGYKTQPPFQSNYVPVDILGKIANVKIEKDKITIEIDLRPENLQMPTSLSSKALQEDLNNNNHNGM